MQEGIILGIITFIGLAIIFKKSPRRVKQLSTRFSLTTDLLASAGAFLLLGGISGSFAAALGAGVTGILFSGFLWWQGENSDRRKQ